MAWLTKFLSSLKPTRLLMIEVSLCEKPVGNRKGNISMEGSHENVDRNEAAESSASNKYARVAGDDDRWRWRLTPATEPCVLHGIHKGLRLNLNQDAQSSSSSSSMSTLIFRTFIPQTFFSESSKYLRSSLPSLPG
jgi:hypothetical protein